MTERVRRLREQSLNAVPVISPERAGLVTEAYKLHGDASTPVLRALTFRHIMEQKSVCISDGELIVGERGPAPKATYTYPELCCHSLADLDILNSREKVPFRVDAQTRKSYEDSFIPFWTGKTVREKIFAAMTEEWKACYDAGIFTEFMEQRAPGHTVLDGKIYQRGLLDFRADIALNLRKLEGKNDTDSGKRREELKAMAIAIDAVITMADRYAAEAERCASAESDGTRKSELLDIARICRRVPAHPPSSFHEALQAYWFVHLGVITELNPWDAFNPGRLDQHLHPFYQQDIDKGVLTRDRALELLHCFWIKFNNQPAPPKVGVTAAESSTYTDFANINSGGLKTDGTDGVNELTYMILDVIDEMRLVQPSSNIQVSALNPDEFLRRAGRIIRKGWGQPSVFNADTIIQEMLRQGKSIEDARDGGTSGCVETGAFGKESYILTGYFNMPKVLEITLNNGTDPRTGKEIGVRTGDPAKFGTFGSFLDAYTTQLHHFIEIKYRGNQVIERIFAEQMPVPFLSTLIDDCIAKGKDYNDGGARYNTTYIQAVGLGTTADCLSSIKHHVFGKKTFTMKEMLRAVASDFEGAERTRLMLVNKTPKYGNDDESADEMMLEVFESYFSEVDGRPNTKGGFYRANYLPTTCHIYFGSVTGALPDGRKAWTPLSEGISPAQGADRNGPTSVLKSAGKMDHKRTGGTLLNQKFTPSLLDGEKGISNLTSLIRSYFAMGGHHIQFNVVKAETLRDAQAHPEQYRDLIVRVAGYSDYFNDLGKTLQDEIIARTEQQGF
jgi:trans-4-hydroxy-L-proline dehydratase